MKSFTSIIMTVSIPYLLADIFIDPEKLIYPPARVGLIAIVGICIAKKVTERLNK